MVLSGILRRETHPGPPGYQDTANGDVPETGFYLHVAPPVCTNANVAVSDGEAEDSVSRIQLVIDSSGYATLRPFIGRRVSLSGTLFSSFSGHHHAPLLLRSVEHVR